MFFRFYGNYSGGGFRWMHLCAREPEGSLIVLFFCCLVAVRKISKLISSNPFTPENKNFLYLLHLFCGCPSSY